MKFTEQIKGLISRGEIQEASTDILEDTINAILGDPISVGKIMIALAKSPFFVREQIFWTKIEAFLNGTYLNENDCAKLRAKLTEDLIQGGALAGSLDLIRHPHFRFIQLH